MSQLLTPAQRKLNVFKAQALAGHWSSTRLAREAEVSEGTAMKALHTWNAQIQEERGAVMANHSPDLAAVARNAQAAHMRLIGRITPLIERVSRQLELSEDIDPGDLDKLNGTLAKHWQHVERLTGLDVVKQIAVRREANKMDQAPDWRGVGELDALPAELVGAPAAEGGESLLGSLF